MNWSIGAQRALRRHVYHAVERLDPIRYAQEPAYVAALLARLDGVAYAGDDGRIEIRSTIVADRGPNSAESKWGADFAIVGILHAGAERVEKAVLAQAKRGSLRELDSNAMDAFYEQCGRMAQATDAILGLEVPVAAGAPVLVREIKMSRPTRAISLGDEQWRPPTNIGVPRSLATYLSNRFLLCFHGEQNVNVVRRLGDSRLSHLEIRGESAL